MIETVLLQVALVDLVGDIGRLRVEATVREKDPLAIVAQVRTQRVARRKVTRETDRARLVLLQALEHKNAAAGPRPPAVVLVGQVREHGRGALDKEQRVEVQQWVGQGQATDGPTGFEIELFELFVAGSGGGVEPVFDLQQAVRGVAGRGAQAIQGSCEPSSALERGPRGAQPIGGRRGCRRLFPLGPLAQAALRGRLVQGNVFAAADRVDADLVQVEVDFGLRKLEADVPRLHAVERDDQRLLVRVPVEHRPVVLIDLAKRPALGADQHLDAGGADRHRPATVVQNHAVDGCGPDEVNLPPRCPFECRVESPLPVDDAVNGTGGILLEADLGRPVCLGGGAKPELGLEQPVSFELLFERCTGRQCHEGRQHGHKCAEYGFHGAFLAGSPRDRQVR